jgi:hypothetical protein
MRASLTPRKPNEIAVLKAARTMSQPQPVKDEPGARVTLLNDERSDLPSLKEMEKLFAAAKSRGLPWPQAKYYDEHQLFRSFSGSFRWLANQGRSERPNGKIDLSVWLDNCRAWLRARNSVGSGIDANGLILAVLASGDVPYTPANPAIGDVWEIGIEQYAAGRKASPDAWRRILKEGAAAILPPSARAQRMAAASPVRVITGSGW